MRRVVWLLIGVWLLAAGAVPGGAAAWAAAGRPSADLLLDRLAAAGTEHEAHAIERALDRLWARSGDPKADAWMAQGRSFLAAGDLGPAAAAFQAAVAQAPGYAEGWNELAMTRYLQGRLGAAVADLSRVLAIQPRHFGALQGLADICLDLDEPKMALRVFRFLQGVDPKRPGLADEVAALTAQVDGLEV